MKVVDTVCDVRNRTENVIKCSTGTGGRTIREPRTYYTITINNRREVSGRKFQRKEVDVEVKTTDKSKSE